MFNLFPDNDIEKIFSREPLFNFTQIDRVLAPDKYKITSHATEDDENVYVEFTVPGYEKDQIDIDFSKRILTISAEISEEAQTFLLNSFAESIIINRDVDGDNISAKLERGILKVTMPLLKRKGSKIKIK